MDNPGILIIGAWITFFTLFVVALIAVIAPRNRSRAPVIATVTLAALLIVELWAISRAFFEPDIAEPGPSAAASVSDRVTVVDQVTAGRHAIETASWSGSNLCAANYRRSPVGGLAGMSARPTLSTPR